MFLYLYATFVLFVVTLLLLYCYYYILVFVLLMFMRTFYLEKSKNLIKKIK